MDIDLLLSTLSKVRSTGSGKWVACCPAHADKTPSMRITELPDRILIHCFAGCSVESILESVGLDFGAICPDDDNDDWKEKRRRPKPEDLEDTFFAEIYKADVRRGVTPTHEETARYKQIISARRLAA